MAQIDLKGIGPWVTTGDPTTVNDATPLFAPGQVGIYFPSKLSIGVTGSAVALASTEIPRVYQYVKLDAASATPVQGQCVGWKDALTFTVTTVASNTTGQNSVAGVLLNASATLGNYVWIGVSGVFPVLATGSTPAAGGSIHGTGAAAGEFGYTAAGTAGTALILGKYLGAKAAAFGGVTPGANVAFALLNVPRFGA